MRVGIFKRLLYLPSRRDIVIISKQTTCRHRSGFTHSNSTHGIVLQTDMLERVFSDLEEIAKERIAKNDLYHLLVVGISAWNNIYFLEGNSGSKPTFEQMRSENNIVFELESSNSTTILLTV